MNENEMITKLIDGDSLYTYMVPDDRMPSNRPLHSEGFYLPHVLIKGDIFWGMSRPAHLGHVCGEGLGVSMFCYTNGFGGIFASYNPGMKRMHLMQPNRYKTHRFILKEEWNTIWDSELEEAYPNKAIHAAIKRGVSFKVAMLDVENIWNIHAVDLPVYYINTETFEIKTECIDYPAIAREIETINRLAEEYQAYFNSKPTCNEDGVLTISCNAFKSFYNLSCDGDYENVYDIPRGSRQRYKRLKVFCEKE
jgi:hypothetical protein